MIENSECIIVNLVKKVVSAGGIVAPSFILEAETAWDTTTDPKTTASFDVETGDVLVAFSVMENGLGDEISISSTPALTWNQLEEYGQGDAGLTYISIWTATATSNTSMTVEFNKVGAPAYNFGGNVLVFRGSSGVGAAEQNNNGTGSDAPSVNITTTQANSVIVVANGDWNATEGARTWLTNAGTLEEVSYFADGATYGLHGGYHPNAGAIGTYTVGLSAPATQRYGIVAVEVKGQ